jgi:two-component system, OmpR family, phosphate regulon sensor histidine kinase PhoR
VSGNLQLLRDSKKQDPSLIDESISTIMSMTGSLGGLLELTSLSLPEKITPTDLESAIEEEIQLKKESLEKKHITITTNIKPWAKLPIDPKHFSLLFGNLLKNAITYNRDSGTIEVEADGKSLSVRDSGIGMDEEELSKIWERFYRADRSGKNAGNGIGLSIVDRIVKLYGWKISAESSSWEGTTFRLRTK